MALPLSAHAAAAATAAPDAREFDRVQVTATRTERAVSDVAATVDVIDREQMDRHLVQDIKDLLRYEPGLSVNRSAARFGLGSIRIRGLDGNRVRVQTDGIAMPTSFNIGSFSNANRNFTDLDTLKRVEIVRGPASSLYGSDALGGVVAFVTKDPADYLKDGKDSYVGLKFGYDGEWKGLLGGVTTAFGGEHWSGMVNINHRQGQETVNKGDVRSLDNTRTAPNPQDRDGRSGLAKLVYAPSEDQRFRLTVEGNEDKTETNVLSSIDRTTTTGMKARDKQNRTRVSFAHEMDALDKGFADSLHWQVYSQNSETTQVTDEDRELDTIVPDSDNQPYDMRTVVEHVVERDAALARALPVRFDAEQRIWLGDEDVTLILRSEESGMNASRVSALPAVRDALVDLQLSFQQLPGLVADGRDMGTVIFPHAPLKVYLSASAACRAERRHKQLISKGIAANISALRADLEARDARDMNRSVAPLKPAQDSMLLDSSELSIEEVAEQVLSWWQERQPFGRD